MKKLLILLCLASVAELMAQPHAAPGGEQTAVNVQDAGSGNGQGNSDGRKRRWCNPELMDNKWLNHEAIAELNMKDRETFNTMVMEHNQAMKPLKSEYMLRAAELRYLIDAKLPDMSQIEKKLDELAALEKKMQLEKISFKLRILKAFPSLDREMAMPK